MKSKGRVPSLSPTTRQVQIQLHSEQTTNNQRIQLHRSDSLAYKNDWPVTAQLIGTLPDKESATEVRTEAFLPTYTGQILVTMAMYPALGEKLKTANTVVFLCSGNIIRSAFADVYASHIGLQVVPIATSLISAVYLLSRHNLPKYRHPFQNSVSFIVQRLNRSEFVNLPRSSCG